MNEPDEDLPTGPELFAAFHEALERGLIKEMGESTTGETQYQVITATKNGMAGCGLAIDWITVGKECVEEQA